MIHADGLTKRFGSRVAVTEVSFTVDAGEIFGLLGPNGAGKTSTIRMLTGLSWPDGGLATVAGRDPRKDPIGVHRVVGVAPETPTLYQRLPVRDNLRLFARLFDLGDDAVRSAVDRFRLEPVLGQRAGTLSKGWQQRVLIARALLHAPRVVFLDEPTSGLDPNTAAMVRQIIAELRDDGVTIVLCTHNMDEADVLCDRVGFMYQGQLSASGSPARLREARGPRQLVIEYRSDGTIHRDRRHLHDSETADFVHALISAGDVVSLTTEEHTLADVFREVTGGDLT